MLSSVCNNVPWNRGHNRIGRKAWYYHGSTMELPRKYHGTSRNYFHELL